MCQNNELVQTFGVNNLNQLTNVSRSGTLTVSGATSDPATNVTVNATAALRYSDNTFARTNTPFGGGYVASAKDLLGRTATHSVIVTLSANFTNYYDLNGNLIYDGMKSFEYDDENQLVRVTRTNNWKSEFAYDGKMRRRVRKEYIWQGTWVLSNEVRYVYDGNLVIQERNLWNLPQVTYTRGRDLSGSLEGAGGIGGLLARTDHSSLSPAHACYFADGNGNVSALINTQQIAVAKYQYDSFGNLLAISGPMAEANLYRFSSKEWNENAGLAYYLYRYYAPELQRWVNRDPLGELGFEAVQFRVRNLSHWSRNVYTFCRNRPIDKIDAYGLTDTITSIIIQCAKMPGKDFLSCVCLFAAPDDEECEKRFKNCLGGLKPGVKLDVFKLCTCACELIEDETARKDCVDACKNSKKVKKACDNLKPPKPGPEPDFP